MKIQIAGDLHIEYIDFEDSNVSDLLQPGDTDLLILAGDIGSLYEPQKLRFFLEKVCVKYRYVLYVYFFAFMFFMVLDSTLTRNYRNIEFG